MSLTCVTCRVAFANTLLHREHYKNDWHRYNLKRKVAELPPVSADVFQQKLNEQNNTENKPDERVTVVLCKPCHKNFSSVKAYDNHVLSKKHATSLLKYAGPPGQDICLVAPKVVARSKPMMNEEELEVEEVDSDEWEDIDVDVDGIPTTNCLFCQVENKSLEENLRHMSLAHSFFIPDIEYVTDIEGLIQYLGKKVGAYYLCLWCCGKGKQFKSLNAAQKHMTDMGHTKMLHEGEALHEYSPYYDYTSSHPDNDGNLDGDVEAVIPIIESDGYELVLPSGAVIGHRSLFKYYRQSLPPKRISSGTTSSLVTHYRALGWKGSTPAVLERKARDIKFMNRISSKLRVDIGVKSNKLQKHFRPQVNF